MFDLEKAKAEHRVTEWYDHWRPAALDEIERLQAREQQLKLDVNRVHNETMTYKAAYGKQAARIQYLEDADGSNPPLGGDGGADRRSAGYNRDAEHRSLRHGRAVV